MESVFAFLDRVKGQVLIPTDGWINNWNQKKDRLQRRIPTDEELMNKWWRTRTLTFIKRSTESRGHKRNERHHWALEDRLWQRYSQFKVDWVKHRLRLIQSVPSFEELRSRWWRKRSQTFFKEQMGIKSGSYQRKYFRFDVFLYRIVWCNHSQCFALRLTFLFWLILHLIIIFFAFYAYN